MIAYFDEHGTLVVKGETWTEAYALNAWHKEEGQYSRGVLRLEGPDKAKAMNFIQEDCDDR